jgi:hypothetical protein
MHFFIYMCKMSDNQTLIHACYFVQNTLKNLWHLLSVRVCVCATMWYFCVHMHVFMYINIYIYMYTHAQAHKYMYKHTFMHKDQGAYKHKNTQIYECTRVQTEQLPSPRQE